MSEAGLGATVNVAERRAQRDEQREHMAPLMVGRMTPMMKRLWDNMPRLVGAIPSDTALVSGTPASPGRATGSVRVARGPRDFDQLQPGVAVTIPSRITFVGSTRASRGAPTWRCMRSPSCRCKPQPAGRHAPATGIASLCGLLAGLLLLNAAALATQHAEAPST